MALCLVLPVLMDPAHPRALWYVDRCAVLLTMAFEEEDRGFEEVARCKLEAIQNDRHLEME